MGNLIEFDEDFIRRVGEGLGLRVGFVTKEFSRALIEGVSARTPKKSGRARNNWNVGVGAIDPTVRPAAAGASDYNASLERVDGRLPVFVTNSLKYINKLENGSSKQAPAGMARAAEANARSQLTDIIGKAQNVPLA